MINLIRETKNYKFFQNKKCEFYPYDDNDMACHPESDPETHNCLFCYCPLYLDDECGGDYEIMDNGLKDCSNCLLPHKLENYNYIIDKLKEL